MKILHVVFALETGGAETMLVDIVNEQAKQEHVELLIINNSVNYELLKALRKNIKVHYLNRKPGSFNPFKIIQFNYTTYRINPDIIHFHDHKGIKLLKYNNKAKTFLTIHDINDPVSNLPKYDQLISISDSVRKDVLIRGRSDSTRIYNGVNFGKIKGKSNYNDFQEFRIVQVSRLHHEKKGQHILLNSIHQLIHKYDTRNIKVHFIGEGHSYDYLCQLSKELNISSHIEFLGNRDRSYIYSHLRDYNLLIQPSIYEGFGLTVVEGIAARLPVIVSNVDGPAEIIKGLPSCFQFESKNADSLTKSILSIKNSYQAGLVEEQCKISYSAAFDKFSIRKTSERYLARYKA